jgi:hypothetical protein
VAKTRDALKIIDRFTGDNRALRALIEGEILNARLAPSAGTGRHSRGNHSEA